METVQSEMASTLLCSVCASFGRHHSRHVCCHFGLLRGQSTTSQERHHRPDALRRSPFATGRLVLPERVWAANKAQRQRPYLLPCGRVRERYERMGQQPLLCSWNEGECSGFGFFIHLWTVTTTTRDAFTISIHFLSVQFRFLSSSPTERDSALSTSRQRKKNSEPQPSPVRTWHQRSGQH